MNAPNRVDELRKRYHENPRRFFAPLANEYRKTGFVDRAILLCEKHLSEQPGNMNGLVVYGQCLFETGRLEDARQPFEMALAVDPENLIALRHLGDIARLSGDAPKAREWYERVLEFDRRNEEVIALMAEVGGGEEKPATTSQAPNIVSVAGSVRVANDADALGMIDLDAPASAAESVRAATPRASAAVTRPATPAATARPVTPAPSRAVPLTPMRPLGAVDPSAKTVEVAAQTKPLKRASLLDVAFDFGEAAAEPPSAAPRAPEALLPAEAAEYGFAAPEAADSVEDEIDSLDSFSGALPSLPLPSEVEGIEKAEFSAEVSPLDGLEPSEFHPPDRPSGLIEGLESDEFQPLGLEESFGGDIEVTHDDPFGGESSGTHDAALHDVSGDSGPLDLPPAAEQEEPEFVVEPAEEPADEIETAATDHRASMAGLPLLTPIGTPTPMATPTVNDLPMLPSLEEAETIPIDLEAARRQMETPPTFVTETMARVYVEQGHTDKAIDVYRQLIAQAPNDAGLRERLSALESPPAPEPIDIDEMIDLGPPATPAAPAAAPATDTRGSFGFDTPLSTDPVEEHAPANSMLSATSFDGISLTTPATPSRASTPIAAPVVAPILAAIGQSAREFFSRFARRAATPTSMPSVEGAPTIGGQLMSPLDELFGTNVPSEDEVAAHRLAGVGATSGPSGGTALDSLFGEGPSAPMPSTTPSRGSVTRASEKLRFDQFFASSTPVEGSLSTPTPAAAPAPPPMQEPASADDGEEPGEDDDLDQFQGWLRGLTS